jgi:hypothetical protein
MVRDQINVSVEFSMLLLPVEGVEVSFELFGDLLSDTKIWRTFIGIGNGSNFYQEMVVHSNSSKLH